ncbi:hypothetical protein DRJ25_00375, partial [Candidatus Woesearchaeota archaeon]
ATGTWTDASSRTFKEDFKDVDSKEILDKLMALDIKNYKYKGDNPARHITPFAEAIYYTFNVGENPKYLSALDVAGLSMVAIQQLKKENNYLKERVESLEQRLSALENKCR